jgi:hypothetical protein
VIEAVDLVLQEFNMDNLELFDLHKKICGDALELMRKKNHDYSGKSGKEPFANFTRSEAMGITTTEKGILVRLLDKISRLSSFCDSGEFKVDDEKLEDTIIDAINYNILLYAYIMSKKNNKQMKLPFTEAQSKPNFLGCYDMFMMNIPRDKGNICHRDSSEEKI